jgi:hypothetical protein
VRYIENIVIGIPLIKPEKILANSVKDWVNNESEKTVHTLERFLPEILVNYGFTTSISEIRRNRPDLVKTLNKPDFLKIKLGKRKLWILVGK